VGLCGAKADPVRSIDRQLAVIVNCRQSKYSGNGVSPSGKNEKGLGEVTPNRPFYLSRKIQNK